MKNSSSFKLTMKTISVSLILGLSACVTPTATSSAEDPTQISASTTSKYAESGVFSVTTAYETWRDIERGRDIMVKLYKPAGDAAAPVVVFSHGLGGSVEAAPYLGKHLASWGFLAVHVQHPGSDAEVWAGLKERRAILGALKQAAKDPKNAIDRYNDIPFVLNEIERRSASGELHADSDRMALAGHSFGAHTVIALAGRQYKVGKKTVSFKDTRLRAGMALSPPSPQKKTSPADYEFIYGSIDLPLLHVTGTEDGNPLDSGDAAINRQIPFSQISKAPQYLLVFDGADHTVFGGGGRRRRSPDWYPQVQAQVAEAATAFFLAYVVKDVEARAFIDGPSFIAVFDPNAEIKRH